jgi:hypothetical protein
MELMSGNLQEIEAVRELSFAAVVETRMACQREKCLVPHGATTLEIPVAPIQFKRGSNQACETSLIGKTSRWFKP